MPRSFDVPLAELAAHIEDYVDAVYADLQSSFLVMPKGTSFVEYGRFQEAYEHLKAATRGFEDFSAETVWSAIGQDGLVLLVTGPPASPRARGCRPPDEPECQQV